MALAAAVLFHAGRDTGFFYDEWNFVLDRGGTGAGVVLEPHNEHLSLVPIVVYKTLFVLVGLDDHWVYRGVLTVLHLTCCGLLYRLCREHVGGWGALAATLPVLVLGAAWEDLLWPFQIGFLTSIAAGLGALVLIGRGTRRADLGAAGLLTVSVASSSLGIPLLIGAAVYLLVRPDGRARAIRVLAAPAVLYGLWYLAYGRSALQGSNLVIAPDWIAESVAVAAGALAGQGLDWGRPLALIAVALLVARLLWRRPAPPLFWGALAFGASFYVLTGLARAGYGEPAASRYVYVGAVALMLTTCAALAGLRPPPRAALIAVAVAAVAAAMSLPEIRDAGRNLRAISSVVEGELGAVELAGRRLPAEYKVDNGRAPQITAGRYLSAVAGRGSSPATPAETLPQAGGAARIEADRVLLDSGALPVAPAPTGDAGVPPGVELAQGGTARPRGGCVRFAPSGPGAALDLAVPPEGIVIRGAGELRARRFFEGFPERALGAIPARGARLVKPVADASPAPWHLRVSPAAAVDACLPRS